MKQTLILNSKLSVVSSVLNNIRHVLQKREGVEILYKQDFSDALHLLELSSDDKEEAGELIERVISLTLSFPPEAAPLYLSEVLKYSLKEKGCNISIEDLQSIRHFQVPRDEGKRESLIAFLNRSIDNVRAVIKPAAPCF